MFVIITLLAITGLMGTDLFAPSLPEIAEFFQQTPNHAQLTISLFLLGFALSQLFYGPISDRIGRKLPLIFGISLFVIGSIVCALTFSFNQLCLGRIIQGLGAGAGLSLGRVILRDCYSGTQLAIKSAQSAVFVSLTPALAPFLGGIFQQFFGFRASFIFMLAYGFLLLFLLLVVFTETIQQKSTHIIFSETLRQYSKLLTHSLFVRYAMITGLAFSSIILYANVMPFIIQKQLHLSPMVNGSVLLLAALGISLGSLISSRVVARISPEQLITYGLFIYLISGFILFAFHYFFGNHLILLVLPIFLITIGCGLIFPNAIAVCFSTITTNIGIAGAIYGSMQTLISMLVNFLLNLMPNQNQSMLGILYFLIGLLGLILACLLRKKEGNILTIKTEQKDRLTTHPTSNLKINGY